MVHEGMMRSALRKYFFLPNVCQNRRLRTQTLIPGSTVIFPPTQWKWNICSFNKENYLKAGFCHIIESCSSLKPSERTKSRKHFVVKSIDFDRFMTSECTKTLILAFTSKTGQSAEHTRHRIVLFGFFSGRKRIY